MKIKAWETSLSSHSCLFTGGSVPCQTQGIATVMSSYLDLLLWSRWWLHVHRKWTCLLACATVLENKKENMIKLSQEMSLGLVSEGWIRNKLLWWLEKWQRKDILWVYEIATLDCYAEIDMELVTCLVCGVYLNCTCYVCSCVSR